MATITIRVPETTHTKLLRLAQEQNRSLGQVIDDMVSRYEREVFLRGVNEDFTRLRANPEAWAEYQAEMAIWDNAHLDGLEEDPWTEG